MKIASWNVNSLKVRLPHLLDWLAAQQPDVLCLQELKLEDAKFPLAEIEAAGYRAAFAGQKTYNGVALLARQEIADVQINLPNFPDEQKRLIAGTVGDVRVVCAYMPNGQEVGSDKYAYKLAWLAALAEWLQAERVRYPKLALCGDYNIAPDDRDVHNPAAWEGKILCSAPERAAFRRFLELGLSDSFRLFDQPEKTFSWWDYRMLGFQKNLGLRIDHILLSAPLAAVCSAAGIDRAPRKLERPSDHAPAWATLNLA
ncbi:MAG: exodeoxyribonuclease III [Azonexus sp.]|nr:exodeoxyribonuclease III [Azonexus sp.]MCK6411758.1 exodeoxyribonuclease III [Azonexus sp.]